MTEENKVFDLNGDDDDNFNAFMSNEKVETPDTKQSNESNESIAEPHEEVKEETKEEVKEEKEATKEEEKIAEDPLGGGETNIKPQEKQEEEIEEDFHLVETPKKEEVKEYDSSDYCGYEFIEVEIPKTELIHDESGKYTLYEIHTRVCYI